MYLDSFFGTGDRGGQVWIGTCSLRDGEECDFLKPRLFVC
jgi:hypothetical protein